MPKECKWDQSIGTAMRSSNGLQSHGIRFEGCSTWDSLGGPFFTFNSLCFWPKRSPVGPKQPHVTVTDLTSHHLATKKTSSKSVVFFRRCCRFGIVNGYGYSGDCGLGLEIWAGGLGHPWYQRNRVAALGLFWCSFGGAVRPRQQISIACNLVNIACTNEH